MGRGAHEPENSIALSSRRAAQKNGRLTSKSWLTNRLLEERLAASKAEYWLSAEADAQAAVFMRTATIGSTVMLLPDSLARSPLTRQLLERLGIRTTTLPAGPGRSIDQTASIKMISLEHPDFILIDPADASIAHGALFLGTVSEAVTVFDVSRTAGEILGGRLASPLRRGYDLVTFTLGDTAGVASREDGEVWRRMQDAGTAQGLG